MFGKIVYISNNMAHVQLGENVTTDIMNMHVIFEKDGVKILGEVEDIIEMAFLTLEMSILFPLVKRKED